MENFREYISIGINHHLLCKFLALTAQDHCKTLLPILEDERFDVIDLWIVEEEPYKSEEINVIKNSGKQIIYNVGDRAENPIMYPTATEPKARTYALDMFKSEIERGVEVGATKIVTSSGPQYPGTNKEEANKALIDFYCELCDFIPKETLLLIEPTDTDFDKRFFLGSSSSCAKLVSDIHEEGYTNFASMIDMCHLPQLGETIPQAFHDLGSYMQHIHLGTCVVKDCNNPFYGDKHPGWGVLGTNWAEHEIADLIIQGFSTGYFSRESKGTASFEMVAYEGIPYLDSISTFFNYMDRAWRIVRETMGDL